MEDRIAQERYRDMKASENMFFTLHHCWKIVEHSEKWKLRDQEAPNTLDDDDSDDAQRGGIKKEVWMEEKK
jgi:hypothetical protein